MRHSQLYRIVESFTQRRSALLPSAAKRTLNSASCHYCARDHPEWGLVTPTAVPSTALYRRTPIRRKRRIRSAAAVELSPAQIKRAAKSLPLRPGPQLRHLPDP